MPTTSQFFCRAKLPKNQNDFSGATNPPYFGWGGLNRIVGSQQPALKVKLRDYNHLAKHRLPLSYIGFLRRGKYHRVFLQLPKGRKSYLMFRELFLHELFVISFRQNPAIATPTNLQPRQTKIVYV